MQVHVCCHWRHQVCHILMHASAIKHISRKYIQTTHGYHVSSLTLRNLPHGAIQDNVYTAWKNNIPFVYRSGHTAALRAITSPLAISTACNPTSTGYTSSRQPSAQLSLCLSAHSQWSAMCAHCLGGKGPCVYVYIHMSIYNFSVHVLKQHNLWASYTHHRAMPLTISHIIQMTCAWWGQPGLKIEAYPTAMALCRAWLCWLQAAKLGFCSKSELIAPHQINLHHQADSLVLGDSAQQCGEKCAHCIVCRTEPYLLAESCTVITVCVVHFESTAKSRAFPDANSPCPTWCRAGFHGCDTFLWWCDTFGQNAWCSDQKMM